MAFPTTYQTDGSTTDWSFDFPYLERSDVFVTVNEAARPFTFLDDGTIRCVDTLGNPFAKGLTLVISRATPDLISLAQFKDAANLTAADLNRARLQLLFLIQERSGGMAGAVGTVISNLTNEITTISGALDTIGVTQGVLQAGLDQFQGLSDRLSTVENGAQALMDQLQQEIDNRVADDSTLSQTVSANTLAVNNLKATVQSDITLLQSSNEILAAQQQSLQAQIDAIPSADGSTNDDDAVAAALITSSIASVKQDSALAEQITSLQASIGDNISQVLEDMKTEVDAVDGKVTNLQAQWTLKAQVTRDDGTVVMGGIGLAATANDDYVGSKLVLMADSILFADPNTPDGDLVTFLEAGLVDGQATLVVPSTIVGDQTIPGRVLVDGSIEARSIAANTITGDKLVAGTIDTDRLAVGLGTNLLSNSVLLTTAGWGLGADNVTASTAVLGLDLTGWFPVGGHTMYVHSTGTWASDTDMTTVAYVDSARFSIVGGNFYEFSAYVGVHRCKGDIGIWWCDSNNAVISGNGFGSAGTFTTVGQASGGTSLTGYVRIGSIFQAPANAAAAFIRIRKGMNTAADGTDSYLWVTQPMAAQTTASATRLSPYTPSGQGTLITAAGISTPSLSAISANIGTLQSATTGQRTVINNNGLFVYDANNVQRVVVGVW